MGCQHAKTMLLLSWQWH